MKLSKEEWTAIFQSLKNELRITEETDDMTDGDTQSWAKFLEKLVNKISKTLPVERELNVKVK